MKVLVCGKNGQLAQELRHNVPSDWRVEFYGREQVDIADANALNSWVANLQPGVIINAAAYTAVDKAESNADEAFRTNELGPANLARAAKETNAYLVHISTDFVFDGSHNRPYLSSAPTAPLGVYGASKLAGEKQIQALYPEKSAIVRTAWVYSAHGNNFVQTMLRLMNEKPALSVVADQIGTPTWAAGLARISWQLAQEQPTGTFHWTDAGVASWYDFAVAIQELGLELGLLKNAIPITPIPTEAYPTPAKRPHYSVLDKRSLLEALPDSENLHWRQQLASMMMELKQLETSSPST